jgi:hypothetical protein
MKTHVKEAGGSTYEGWIPFCWTMGLAIPESFSVISNDQSVIGKILTGFLCGGVGGVSFSLLSVFSVTIPLVFKFLFSKDSNRA